MDLNLFVMGGMRFFVCAYEVYLFYDFFKHARPMRLGDGKLRLGLASLQTAVIFLIEMLVPPPFCFPFMIAAYWGMGTLCFEVSFRWQLVQALCFCSMIKGLQILGEYFFQISKIEHDKLTAFFSAILFEKLAAFMILKTVQTIFRKRMLYMARSQLFGLFVLPAASLCILIGAYLSGVDGRLAEIHRFWFSFGMVGLMISNGLVFYYFERMEETMLQAKNQELQILKSNMEQKGYEKLEQENQKHVHFIHNINAYLRTIGNLAVGKNTEEIIDVINHIGVELYGTQEVFLCDNKIFNAILSEYCKQAQDFEVDFQINLEQGLDISFMNPVDVCAVIGNLLSNAMESASRCQGESRFARIQVYTANEGAFLMVRVENGCGQVVSGKDGLPETTKSKRTEHGLGMRSIREVAEKYGGWFRWEVQERRFICLFMAQRAYADFAEK